MSEHITHTALTDDCARLTCFCPTTADAIREALADHPDIARLGGITRRGDEFTVGLLNRIRDGWAAQSLAERLPEKLAFVLGWMCHRAADRQMKPLFRRLDAGCTLKPTDCSIYHDVFLFREVYGGGAREPYSQGTLSADLGADELEQLLRTIWQRSLIAMHTFIPDADDIDGWLERVFSLRQRFTVDLRRYAEVLANPDHEKTQRFLREPNFYDGGDPLIALARDLQAGRVPPLEALPAALQAAPQSQYAQALRRAYDYVQAASRYFLREINERQLSQALDVGKPGG